ncbi:hypothetical protein AND_001898 [Anopheles darlingi]|uniref:Uncharacterized protein n=1 Tax=Anopheles darlingi TaxID=43151 RepID=W5JSN5_ANODA|nr:hypothetical protein AND_001898 [Anopheles darlingi]
MVVVVTGPPHKKHQLQTICARRAGAINFQHPINPSEWVAWRTEGRTMKKDLLLLPRCECVFLVELASTGGGSFSFSSKDIHPCINERMSSQRRTIITPPTAASQPAHGHRRSSIKPHRWRRAANCHHTHTPGGTHHRPTVSNQLSICSSNIVTAIILLRLLGSYRWLLPAGAACDKNKREIRAYRTVINTCKREKEREPSASIGHFIIIGTHSYALLRQITDDDPKSSKCEETWTQQQLE